MDDPPHGKCHRIGRVGRHASVGAEKETHIAMAATTSTMETPQVITDLVTGHKPVRSIMGVVYRCPNITKESNGKIQNAIREVCKGDCIVMVDFIHGIHKIAQRLKIKNVSALYRIIFSLNMY